MTEQPFEFVFQDNRAYMYADAPHCPDCSRVLDSSWIAPDFRLDGHEFDLSMTSDGCLIASDRFIATTVDVAGLAFEPIPSLPGFSVVEISPTFRLDPFMNRIRFGVDCPTCDEPRFVVRDGPLMLALDSDVSGGFSRSLLEFGDTADFGPSQPMRLMPVIAADEATVRTLKDAGLTGIHVIAP